MLCIPKIGPEFPHSLPFVFKIFNDSSVAVFNGNVNICTKWESQRFFGESISSFISCNSNMAINPLYYYFIFLTVQHFLDCVNKIMFGTSWFWRLLLHCKNLLHVIALQWHAMQWHAMHWHAMQWHAMQWHAMQWCAIQWRAMQWHAMQWHAMQCHCIACHCISCHCISCHCIALHVIALQVIALHVITKTNVFVSHCILWCISLFLLHKNTFQ